MKVAIGWQIGLLERSTGTSDRELWSFVGHERSEVDRRAALADQTPIGVDREEMSDVVLMLD